MNKNCLACNVKLAEPKRNQLPRKYCTKKCYLSNQKFTLMENKAQVQPEQIINKITAKHTIMNRIINYLKKFI